MATWFQSLGQKSCINHLNLASVITGSGSAPVGFPLSAMGGVTAGHEILILGADVSASASCHCSAIIPVSV